MRKESDCPQEQRYLYTDELFSAEAIRIWQQECTSRIESRNLEKDSFYHKFIHWKPNTKEVALFTLYAYADLTIPKQFDCIFELGNPTSFVRTKFTLTQSVFEAWWPINRIEDGYKHLCIFEFEDEIPALLNGLHIASTKMSSVPKGAFKLGFCKFEEFEVIRIRQEYVNNLWRQHGSNWWKYDEKK